MTSEVNEVNNFEVAEKLCITVVISYVYWLISMQISYFYPTSGHRRSVVACRTLNRMIVCLSPTCSNSFCLLSFLPQTKKSNDFALK